MCSILVVSEALKRQIITAPVLAFATFSKSFSVQTAARHQRLQAIFKEKGGGEGVEMQDTDCVERRQLITPIFTAATVFPELHMMSLLLQW